MLKCGNMYPKSSSEVKKSEIIKPVVLKLGWLINGGHGLIIEIFAHVFCAISQLSDPNNPYYYGASIELTKNFLKIFSESFFFILCCRTDSNQRQRNETPLDSNISIPPTPKRIWQGKIRTLINGQRLSDYHFYHLSTDHCTLKITQIMYFHQLLWFLCYHFLTDFKITFTFSGFTVWTSHGVTVGIVH